MNILIEDTKIEDINRKYKNKEGHLDDKFLLKKKKIFPVYVIEQK